MKIKVSITDDHPMTLEGLHNTLTLQANIALVGMYRSGKELMDGLLRVQPDMLLLDIHLPDMTGDKLAAAIVRKYPQVRIVALTSLVSSFYIYSMIRAGACGYLFKNADTDKIVKAIETVHSGELYLERELSRKMESFAKKMKHRETFKTSLSLKEKGVLKLTLEGYTLQEIAEKLYLGQRTVEYYRSNLLLKLDARNLAELIRKALEFGFLDES